MTADLPDAVLDLPVEDVLPDPDNPRSPGPDDDLPALAASMKEVGQQQPVSVWENPPTPDARRTYTVIVGHRRRAAVMLAGLKTIRAVVVTRPPAAERRHLARMAENKARRSLTPREDVDAVAKAKRENPGMTGRQVADTTGYSESEVSKCAAVAACPVAYAALADGRLASVNEAYGVARAAGESKAGLIALKAGGAPSHAVANNALKPPAAGAAKPGRVLIPLPKAKATVTVASDAASVDGVIAVLAEALEAARKAQRENLTLATAKRAWADKAAKSAAAQ